ncbi:MAG TPA: hypothetical protein VHG08_28625 [Longimicrobium sp.]|nr:hypothetical protein [Longimicrobium sp.]
MHEERKDEGLRAAIEAGKEQFDRDHPPGPDVLPRDQWKVVPDDGHRAYFTEDEIARAGAVFLPPAEARAYARELYADGSGFFLPEDALSALSLISPELAERVRLLMRETHEQARDRVEEFRTRLALWHDRGSPADGFPDKES